MEDWKVIVSSFWFQNISIYKKKNSLDFRLSSYRASSWKIKKNQDKSNHYLGLRWIWQKFVLISCIFVKNFNFLAQTMSDKYIIQKQRWCLNLVESWQNFDWILPESSEIHIGIQKFEKTVELKWSKNAYQDLPFQQRMWVK